MCGKEGKASNKTHNNQRNHVNQAQEGGSEAAMTVQKGRRRNKLTCCVHQVLQGQEGQAWFVSKGHGDTNKQRKTKGYPTRIYFNL